jgi:hypothetical protein
MQENGPSGKLEETKTKLIELEYELIGKYLEEYKKKLDNMSDSEIHQIVLDRLVESLRDQKRLTKGNLQQQVTGCIGQEYWEKIEDDVEKFLEIDLPQSWKNLESKYFSKLGKIKK